MPAPTVTVRADSFREMTWFRFLVDSRFSLESAIRLKQWRVPRARRCRKRATASRTSSVVDDSTILAVLYVRFPAQFLRFMVCLLLSIPHDARGASAVPAIAAEESLRKVRLSMIVIFTMKVA